MDYEKVGSFIRQKRISKRITQQELAGILLIFGIVNHKKSKKHISTSLHKHINLIYEVYVEKYVNL